MKSFQIKRHQLVLIICLLLLSLNCQQGNMTEHEEHTDHHEHAEHEEGIHLSLTQVQAMDIEFGGLLQLKINDFIRATGTLGLPPNAYASVSVKHAGFIRNSRNYVEGDLIRRGAVLAELENSDFIRYQQQYLETKAELTFLQQELARQQNLAAAEAGVNRNLEQIQSQVASKSASMSGLGQQLAYLGIPLDELSPEKITQRITIFAPRTGYITSINMHDGMYVSPEVALMEIVEEDHLHLELDVFEQDIAQLRQGQQISYTIPAIGAQVYQGKVHVIGREFNTNNKTVRVHGHLEGDRPVFIKDLFVQARIWLNDQTVNAVPENALVQSGSNAFVYAANPMGDSTEIEFVQLRVNPGSTEDGYTAIRLIDPLPEQMQLVTKGAYYVHAQGLAGELEHDH